MQKKPPEKSSDVLGYRALYKKLERTLDTIESSDDIEATLLALLERIVVDFHDQLGFVGGRLYTVKPQAILLKRSFGDSGMARPGYRIPISYPPLQPLLKQGYLLMTERDTGFDPSIEKEVGVRVFAAIAVGRGKRHHIISFTVEGQLEEERILYSLNTIRHVINLKLEQQQTVDMIAEVRDIQMSMLPSGPPSFCHYDIAGQMIPAEVVGGDIFDYIPISERILGIAIADSSGHGLPAALQARDVITGLRMGLEEDLKIIRTIEKLNRVIHRSSLATKFVSLFYAELERNGNFVYCNAGHPPPLLLQDGRFDLLPLGGLLLGPTPSAKYERGFRSFRPGDLLVLYTDGITEALGAGEEEFGTEQFQKAIRQVADRPAAEIVAGILEALDKFTDSASPQDDRTLVVIKNPPANKITA